ncbi:S8 family serine peptidase [Ilumatobacter sp.]|uniref:S8 family serine peptidase n=1 Tax=Ilumatobacter sp. TaxID=1967498 RepID=UPI003B51B319
MTRLPAATNLISRLGGESRAPGTRLGGRRIAACVLASTVGVGALAMPVDAKKADPAHVEQVVVPGAAPAPAKAVAAPKKAVAPEVAAGSMRRVVDQIGARALWDRGITGAGVNVAVIDTGIAPVPALAAEDKVIAAIDFSDESGDPERALLDTHGHGTHMAGIIAGRAPGARASASGDHPEWFLGVAPDAGLVSVKVGDRTGAVDIAQVVAGVHWVVDNADALDIGVLNLSYDSGSPLDYRVDPLTHALEEAWAAGIVVIVAGGNDGRGTHGLSSPANDPFVIGVVAAEQKRNGTFHAPSWGTVGDGVRDPDVAAPGVSIESLRVPGSEVDLGNPAGYVDDQRFKGTGSSQAAAVVSGAAALLRQARPELGPDQIKALLATDATAMTPKDRSKTGAGMIALDRVVDLPAPDGAQMWEPAAGTATFDEARVGLEPGDAADSRPDPTTGVRWSDARWDGVRWSGVRWSDAEWAGVRWSGVRWSGVRWSGVRWSDADWAGVRWSGVRWSDQDWGGVRWSDEDWSGVRWSGVRWSGAHWE